MSVESTIALAVTIFAAFVLTSPSAQVGVFSFKLFDTPTYFMSPDNDKYPQAG